MSTAEYAGESLRIAVTGGIGSGKSYVCHLLEERGISVYDCDAAAKRLMRTSEDIRRQLTLLIGEDAYLEGHLNKAAVARFLMESQENTQKVNAIVHPADLAQQIVGHGLVEVNGDGDAAALWLDADGYVTT